MRRSYQSELKDLYIDFKNRLEQFGSRQLELQGRYSNDLRQKISEHVARLDYIYLRARNSKNVAILRAKRENKFDSTVETELSEKFRKQYMDKVVTENKSFSDWLFMYQNDNLIKSRDSINWLISEMRMAQPMVPPPPSPLPFELAPLDEVDVDNWQNVDMGNFADVAMPAVPSPAPPERRNSFDKFVNDLDIYDNMYDPKLYMNGNI